LEQEDQQEERVEAGHWWLMPITLTTQEERSGRSWFEASPGKQFVRPYLEKAYQKKGWWSGSRYRP
jgi:hypothetical protein